jgi:asparagine synthase (glutamine-hydrolysing)
VLSQDVELYLPHEILAKVDRATMACSLEARAPFLDTDLATFVAGLPLSYKLRRLDGKYLLKRAVRPWLPRGIVDRPKKGFGMPIGAWLRGPLSELCFELLLGPGGLCESGLVDATVVARLYNEHYAGVSDHRKRLWTLMVLALWRRHHRV